jgi:signal transduction histidine kinase
VERVAKIVRAMKEFSHPGSKDKAAVNLNQSIESTITVARSEWKYVADLILDLEPSLTPVQCVPGEFNQVIMNLVINAAHTIADVVGDGSQGKGLITISTRRDGDWVEIRIQDTGKGIPKEIQHRMFEPFFTTKAVGKGTGQGLAMARSVIVEKHGGTITFETEEGRGTTFTIRLPMNPPPVTQDAEAA